MFGSKHKSESAELMLHPGDLDLGETAGLHGPLEFEGDIVAAFASGLLEGARTAALAEDGPSSPPDFAGAIYRSYTGPGGAQVLTRLLAVPSGHAGIASVGIEVGYRKGDRVSASAATALADAVAHALKGLNTVGNVSRSSTISKAMQNEAKTSLA